MAKKLDKKRKADQYGLIALSELVGAWSDIPAEAKPLNVQFAACDDFASSQCAKIARQIVASVGLTRIIDYCQKTWGELLNEAKRFPNDCVLSGATATRIQRSWEFLQRLQYI